MTTMNMTVRLGPRNISLDVGPNGDAYDDDRFLAFGMDTSIFIEKPFDYRATGGEIDKPWEATYQVGGISPQSKDVMQDRVDAMAKAMQIGESVVAWLNVTDTKGDDEFGYQYDPKHVYDYLTGDGFKAMAGIARAK